MDSTTKPSIYLGSYLRNKRQYVVVDSYPSEPLAVGPVSVTQGSALSGILYIIMILDITSIYHETTHNPQEARECQKTNLDPAIRNTCQNANAKTFVDDNIIHTKPVNGNSIQQAVLDVIDKLETYTNANKLALNPEKSRVMVLTKDKKIQQDFQVTVAGKVLGHQPSLKILGNIVSADLTWEEHVRKVVIPSLSNRVRTLKEISTFMNLNFRKNYASAIFRGKLAFAADAWGGTNATQISKVQTLQDRAAKIVLGLPATRKSNQQRLQLMGWPNVKDEIKLATIRLTHKILHHGYPE